MATHATLKNTQSPLGSELDNGMHSSSSESTKRMDTGG